MKCKICGGKVISLPEWRNKFYSQAECTKCGYIYTLGLLEKTPNLLLKIKAQEG